MINCGDPRAVLTIRCAFRQYMGCKVEPLDESRMMPRHITHFSGTRPHSFSTPTPSSYGSPSWFYSYPCPFTFDPQLLDLLYTRGDPLVYLDLRLLGAGLLPGRDIRHPSYHEKPSSTETQHSFPKSQCRAECRQFNSAHSDGGGSCSYHMEGRHLQRYVCRAIMDTCECDYPQREMMLTCALEIGVLLHDQLLF